jgi:MFS family permease
MRVLAINVLFMTGGAVNIFLTALYIPTFLKLVKEIPNSVASLVLIAGSILIIIAGIAAGQLSEMIGRRRTFLVVGVINIVLLPACCLLLARTNDIGMITLYSLVMTFMGAAGMGPVMIFFNERFPTPVRATGTSLSWNIGAALGGTAPTFVSLASGSVQGLPMTLALFLAAGSMIHLIGTLIVPETRGKFA